MEKPRIAPVDSEWSHHYDRIEFIGHCLTRLEQREVSRDHVIEAINNPTSTGHPTEPRRQRIRKEFAGSKKIIDVVCEELPDRVRVITAFPR